MNLEALKRKRAEAVQLIESVIKDAEAADRDVTEAEQADLDAFQAEIETLDRRIKRMESLYEQQKTTAQPVASAEPAQVQQADTSAQQQFDALMQRLASGLGHAQPKEPAHKGAKFARLLRAMAASKGIPRLAAQIADEDYKDPTLAKALAAGTAADGGFLVPEEYSTEIIELLRPRNVVMASAPVILPLSGTLTVPKHIAGAQAEYIGENTNIPKTEQKFGQLRLTERKLAAIVPVSNDLIRLSSPQADGVVRDDLVASMANRSDAAFIRDDGTGNAPKGLRYWAPAANVITANGTVNLQNVRNDLSKLKLALKKANVQMLRPGWLMSPTTAEYLMNLVDSNGNPAFPEMETGLLRRIPFRETTQVPDNLGSGSDEAELYLVDFASAVIGEATGINISVSDVAAYHDGSTVQAAYSLDQTVVRAIMRHDFGMRHDAAVAVLTGVKWHP